MRAWQFLPTALFGLATARLTGTVVASRRSSRARRSPSPGGDSGQRASPRAYLEPRRALRSPSRDGSHRATENRKPWRARSSVARAMIAALTSTTLALTNVASKRASRAASRSRVGFEPQDRRRHQRPGRRKGSQTSLDRRGPCGDDLHGPYRGHAQSLTAVAPAGALGRLLAGVRIPRIQSICTLSPRAARCFRCAGAA